MQVALLGGTGDIGEGLALRLGHDTDHGVVIGSREAGRATARADTYLDHLTDRGVDAAVEGRENAAAAEVGDVVVCCVPAYHVRATVEAVADAIEDAVLVSPAAGITRDDDGFHSHLPSAGSVTRVAVDAAPEAVPVVGAFHTLPADRLADLDADLELDTLLVGDDPEAKATVTALANDIDGLRPVDAGGIANASEVEGVVPLLCNVARSNEGLSDVGVRLE